MSETFSVEQDIKQHTMQLLQTCSNSHCEFHFLSLCFVVSLSLLIFDFFFSSSVQRSVQRKVNLEKDERGKNRRKKYDGVHIIGAVSHSGRAGGSMHPSLRLDIYTVFLTINQFYENKLYIFCFIVGHVGDRPMTHIVTKINTCR